MFLTNGKMVQKILSQVAGWRQEKATKFSNRWKQPPGGCQPILFAGYANQKYKQIWTIAMIVHIQKVSPYLTVILYSTGTKFNFNSYLTGICAMCGKKAIDIGSHKMSLK